MPKPRLPLRRIALCIVLGALTSWLVAWGIATRRWLSELRTLNIVGSGAAVIGDRAIEVTRSCPSPGVILDAWDVRQIDESERKAILADQELSRKVGLLKTGALDALTRSYASLPLSEPERHSASLMIGILKFGWPKPCVRQAMIRCSPTGSTTGPAPTTRWHWTMTVDAFAPKTKSGARGAPLRLPLRPLFPGLLLNTAFYVALWSLPLFTLPLLKQRRRKSRGHCPRCNYNLNHALANGCPECGWNRPAAA